MTCSGQFIPPPRCGHYNPALSSIVKIAVCLPRGVVHYLGLSACSAGRLAFLIVPSLLMRTHWRIYLLPALSPGGTRGLLFRLSGDTAGTLALPQVFLFRSRSLAFADTRAHTTPLPLLQRCPHGKDLSTLSSCRSPVSQIMLEPWCAFFFFVFFVFFSFFFLFFLSAKDVSA